MGKISVKHYLNKKVKASQDPDFGGDLPEYPIYYYITINRKTIHKPSHIKTYLNDDLFEKGITIAGVGNIRELMKAESRMITKACELFLSDYEAGKVNQNYRLLFRRGFTAKDEFINGLNSYIEFYTQDIYSLVCDYARSEINSYLISKLEGALDLSMIKDKERLITLNQNSLFGEVERSFYEKNLDQERLNLYDLEQCLYNCLAATNMKYGYDLPLMEWIYGDLKTTILDTLADKTKGGRSQGKCGELKFSKQYFEANFEPIINKICTLDYQINFYAPRFVK